MPSENPMSITATAACLTNLQANATRERGGSRLRSYSDIRLSTSISGPRYVLSNADALVKTLSIKPTINTFTSNAATEIQLKPLNSS